MDLSSWLWIALFIAFILGWIFSRYDIKTIKAQNKQLPTEYFKGLQHLLNEQPDKAIDSFIQVAKLDPETIELHFALGQMFRKRGEFNRSIRIHESLANRGLNIEYQHKAYIALAEDYYKAGMFDRAENIFNTFINHDIYHSTSLKYLLIIAKLEQDWLKAVNLANFLPLEKKSLQIFHLKMQYIEKLMHEQKIQQIEQEILHIDELYQNHARLLLLKSQILFIKHDINQGIEILLKLIINHSSMLFLVLEKVNLIQKQNININFLQLFFDNLIKLNLNTPSYYSYIYQYLIQQIDLLAQQSSTDKEKENYQEQKNILLSKALIYLYKELENYPSNDIVKRYAKHILNFDTQTTSLEKLFLNKTIQVLEQNTSYNYICRECGFRAKKFSWACHGCSEWESLDSL